MMRKRLLMIVLAALLCLPLGLLACGDPKSDSKTLQKVEIANKTELQAEWYVGDNDRMITLAYTPSDYSVKDITVVSSSDSVTVNAENNLKLRAAKKGNATITVTVDGKTDSVTIAVKDYDAPVDPELEKVEITNKTELQAEWNVGDEDRTIALAYTPNDYTPDEISVTSDGAAVTVDATDKLKLHAAEHGTATITVTADGKTDSVTLTVIDNSVPPLEDLSGITLNESDLTARWIAGEANRDIVVTYGTDGYNSTNTPATASVTSGDAVSVNGLTLTAVKAGTATVTVKVGSGDKEKTATVTVTVLPELNDITVTGANIGNGSNSIDYNGTLNISVAPADNVNYTFAQADIEVISDSTNDVTVTPGAHEGEYTITAKTVGQFTVSITARNNICKTLNINCVPTVPTLNLTAKSKVLAKENVASDLTALACDGTDNIEISVVAKKAASETDIQVEYDAANKKFALAEKGNYTITVTAKDSRDNTKSQTATAAVEVYRNVFKAVSGKKIYNNPEDIIEIGYRDNKKYVTDNEQSVYTDESDVVMAQFDMAASDCYYAEATYTLGANKDLGNVFVGMTHSLPNGDKLPVRWLAAMVDRQDRNFKIKDIDMTKPTSENPFDHATDRLYRNKISSYISDTNALEVKISIARINGCFYTFVNDQFVMMNNDLDYSEPTIPGIFGIKFDSNNADVTVSKMNWIVEQTVVQDKIDQLYTSKLFMYNNTANADPTFSVESSTSDINFTTNVNLDDDAGGILKMGITPYAVFDGDFKVEYDYKITSGEYSAIRVDRGAIFKVLPAYHFAEWKNLTLAAMGVRIIGDNKESGNNVFYHASFKSDAFPSGNLTADQLSNTDEHFVQFQADENECSVTNPYSTYPVHIGDSVHFAFERRVKVDHAEYTYKITIDGKTITRVQQYNGEYWDEPAIFLWFNQSTHGAASNITWQTI